MGMGTMIGADARAHRSFSTASKVAYGHVIGWPWFRRCKHCPPSKLHMPGVPDMATHTRISFFMCLPLHRQCLRLCD